MVSHEGLEMHNQGGDVVVMVLVVLVVLVVVLVVGGPLMWDKISGNQK